MEKVAGVVGRQTRKRGEGKLEMLGPIIGITTSIATIAATGLARGGAAVITGQGRRPMPVRRVVIRKNADLALKRLGDELMKERALRMQVERENARLQETVVAAQEIVDDLMQRVRG